MNALVLEQTKAILRDDFHHTADETLKRFVSEASGLESSDFYWINTRLTERIEPLKEQYGGVVNSQRINNIQRVNKFMEHANRTLDYGQYLVVCMETKDSRRTRILNRYPRFISRPFYAFDFLFKRVFPKLSLTKSLYFKITKGKNRVMSLTEGLGRLVSCGFEIVDYNRFGYQTYIIAKKTGVPAYDMEPTYGALVTLSRIGKDEKLIDVYKLRTMHPYSEYLQEHIYERNGTSNGDKIINDFRVTGWGKWFRKLWIDELPMIWNWLKGDLKLVGVRPLSEHKFYTYPKYLQKKRTKIKPGLVPPFYADLPKTTEEFYNSEEQYLDQYLKRPIRTDIRYFFKAMYNIFIKNARSS